ncbi:cell cycle checkpoint control protein RAD9B [Mugil cephalus]|uniref:cell cycle checkpoint control protein RAD9B n=1 Tax=Mugil cephalus TaxID=48193 RepID=UPI001FB6474A|nr:cell cycle checkpoint control protein RAD9B [Mugil cephalus]
MNCVLEGNCVKAFGKAIHALSRIGDELWLDPMVKGLALRSLNSAHSAYGCFLFSPLFFQKYNLESASKCKMVMKSVLPLFRSLTSKKCNVEQCQISVNTQTDRVIIQFFCRHGITKTHNLRFQHSETLQAEFASHLCPNVLKAPARLLGDMVMHFPVSQEEITLSLTPQRVILRNYYEVVDDHMKKMCTEMCLHPDEFDYFQVRVDSDITFCLKEFRGFLSFAESHCLPVSIHFGAAGKPVCFSVEDMVLEATVVLATLVDCETRAPSQPPETPPPSTPRQRTLLAPDYFCHLRNRSLASHRDVCVCRCEGAAALPVGLSGSNEAQIVPDLTELIPSSQGSPIINPNPLKHCIPVINNPPSKLSGSAATTPASTTVCSLLFRALSSEQDDDGGARFPVLACCSDEEDDEHYPRSPVL